MRLGPGSITKLLRPYVKAVWGVVINYHSTVDGNVYNVTATMANSAAEAETTEGIHFTEQIKDFLIDVADLPVVPREKDSIEVLKVDGQEQFGYAGQWYQVLPDGGARAVEPNTNHEHVHRLHTKNIPAPAETVVAYGNSAGDAYGNSAGDMYGSAGR